MDAVTGRWPGEKAPRCELGDFAAQMAALARYGWHLEAQASGASGDRSVDRAARVAGVQRAMMAARDDGDGTGAGLRVSALRLVPCGGVGL